MQNQNEGSQESLSQEKVKLNKNIGHRCADINAKTAFKIANENPELNVKTMCMANADLYNMIGQIEVDCKVDFYATTDQYVLKAEKELSRLYFYSSHSSVSELVESLSKPAYQFIEMMEESKKPIPCIDATKANLIGMLIYARTRTVLLSEHWSELPDGKNQLFLADEHFEELCSHLKIPRRTRSIINRKKAEGQTHVEISNNN